MKKQFKYAPNITNPNSTRGRPQDPSKWKHGPDPYTHDCYYAFLKHRSQARFRQEQYDLTFEDWQAIWTPETFAKRGRAIDSITLTRVDWDLPWDRDNVQLIKKSQQLKISGEYRRRNNSV